MAGMWYFLRITDFCRFWNSEWSFLRSEQTLTNWNSFFSVSVNYITGMIKRTRWIVDLKCFIKRKLFSTKQKDFFNIHYSLHLDFILSTFLSFPLFSGQHFKQQNFQRKPWPTGFGNYCRFVLYKENIDTMEAVHKLTKFFQ